jgi:NAD(P)-dependent dehydrogenase (short-subunit alcohol dehydrogenase family)
MMNLMITYAMARRLENDGVAVTVMHPGAIKTELTNDMPFAIKLIFKILRTGPGKAASMISKLATDPAYEKANGKFYKFDGKEIKSNAYSHDQQLQEKLWKISEQLS